MSHSYPGTLYVPIPWNLRLPGMEWELHILTVVTIKLFLGELCVSHDLTLKVKKMYGCIEYVNFVLFLYHISEVLRFSLKFILVDIIVIICIVRIVFLCCPWALRRQLPRG